jgi:general secretion pathway protein M
LQDNAGKGLDAAVDHSNLQGLWIQCLWQSETENLGLTHEPGQPFLFVDQLSVQAPASFASSGEGKLRVLLSVAGQWQGAKS